MKIGVVGTGMIAKEVLSLLRKCGWEIEALCSTERSRELGAQLCEKYEIHQQFTDFDVFLANCKADAIYIALPNNLHYAFAKKALEAGHNVILEKPMTSRASEAEELAAIAKEKNLFLYEAISTIYLPNHHKIREWLGRIGEVKVVSCNFSQYSSRYDNFKAGIIAPVFDINKNGGTLGDLNIYNLHYIMALFGAPESAEYHCNLERGVDTSGILTLHYPTFQAVAIAAKNCSAPCNYVIQGTKGYISQQTPANRCGAVTLHLNDGTVETFDDSPESRLEAEFCYFANAMEENRLEECYKTLDYSLSVMKVLTKARLEAGIIFPSDKL